MTLGVATSIFGATMNYEIGKIKLSALASYFKDGTINLIPPFQRGRVWKMPLRKRLLENIVRGKPIPAIFLYKEESGSKYAYNILDGKQRLESILLFIGSNRRVPHPSCSCLGGRQGLLKANYPTPYFRYLDHFLARTILIGWVWCA